MNTRILIAYASRAGPPQGVAEVIGQTLAQAGALVDVRRAKTVTDLSPYAAAAAGEGATAALMIREYLKQAR